MDITVVGCGVFGVGGSPPCPYPFSLPDEPSNPKKVKNCFSSGRCSSYIKKVNFNIVMINLKGKKILNPNIRTNSTITFRAFLFSKGQRVVYLKTISDSWHIYELKATF